MWSLSFKLTNMIQNDHFQVKILKGNNRCSKYDMWSLYYVVQFPES